jgi:uncharacterized protein (DUF1684 family)
MARCRYASGMTHEHHHEHDHDTHDPHDHEGHHHEHVSYPDALQAWRADKDEAFREANDSPIPAENRLGFLGLPYFPVNEALRFEGLMLEPYAGTDPVSFQIETTDGKLRPYVRAGTFRFKAGDAEQRLTAYSTDAMASGSLFVPFMDATTGAETYGAGRYLDLDQDADGTYTLDFNLAYHPLCVYDPKYSCPLTPAENRLPVRIEAGERL